MSLLAIAVVALLLADRGCAFHSDSFEYESTTMGDERRLASTSDGDPSTPVCVDDPMGWTDSYGYDCNNYGSSWCTPAGGYSTGWDFNWGCFGAWAKNGHDATEACCDCGGGAWNNAPPTPGPPSTPAPSPTPASTQAPVPDGYERISPGCVWGNNYVQKSTGISVEDCAALCDADANCLAFEYGVDHGGCADIWQTSDCQLNSGATVTSCNGASFNLDLYVKATTSTATSTTAATFVVAEYTADELLPSGVTASDLMNSTVYKAAKATGLSVALSVPVSDVTITGFTVDARRLSAADPDLSVTVSVTTSFTVQVADASVAEVLSTTIAGAAEAIKTQTNIAMSDADWSDESVITAAPTITDVTDVTITTEDSSTEDTSSKTTTYDVASIVTIVVIGCLF
jgi:hypothetical protein